MAIAADGNDAIRGEQEDELAERRVVGRQVADIEPFVSLLVGPFVIQAGLPHRGNDDPIARQVDRITVALLDGRLLPAGEWPLQRVFGALAFQGHDRPVGLARA